VLTRGFAGSVLVLLGGLVVSALPDSTPLLSIEGLRALREHEVGRMVGLTVVMLGLGMIGAAWLSICRQLARSEDDPADDLALVRYAAAVWSAPLLLAPPLFSRDGWSYAAQGMLTHLGLSPYQYGPGILAGPIVDAVDPRWLFTGTPYGPLPLLLGDFAAQFTGNPWVLVVAHRIVALVGLAMLAWAVPRLASWADVNPALASALVIASPLMLANGVGGLHNDLLMAGLMAAALVVAAERGWWWGAVLGGAAAAVKFPGGLVCIGIALLAVPPAAAMPERLRRLGAVGAVSVGTLVGLGVVGGLGLGWVHEAAVPGTVNTPLSMSTVLGGFLDVVAHHLGLGLRPASMHDLVRTLASLATVLIAGRFALRARTGSRLVALQAVAAVVAAALLLSPVVHVWYFLWLAPFVAPLRLPRLATIWLVIVSLVSGLVAPLDSSLHGAYLAIVVGCLVCAALTGTLLLTRRSRDRLEKIAHTEWLALP